MSGIALKAPDLGEGYYQSKDDSEWKRKGYLGAMPRYYSTISDSSFPAPIERPRANISPLSAKSDNHETVTKLRFKYQTSYTFIFYSDPGSFKRSGICAEESRTS
jgi:hypothetical protein